METLNRLLRRTLNLVALASMDRGVKGRSDLDRHGVKGESSMEAWQPVKEGPRGK